MRNLLCTVALVSVGSATGWASPFQEGRPVAEITVLGLKNSNDEVVRITARSAGIREGQPFSNEAFGKAREALRAKGLYADVFARTEDAPDGRRVRVVFELVENPVVGNILFAGNRSIASSELLAQMTTKPGEVLNTRTLAEDILKIRRYYDGRGFNAVVTENYQFDPRTATLTVPVLETVIESIDIIGLQKTKENVVRRELRSRIGEPLNFRTLNEDVTRLLGLNIFQMPRFENPEVGSEIGKVKVVFNTPEQRTGQVGVSVGYTQRQRLFGTFSLDEQNFQGRGRGLNLAWTISGGIARDSFELGFSEPWIDGRNTSLGVSLYDRIAFRFNRIFGGNLTTGAADNQYFEQRRGGSVRLSRPLTEDRFTRAFASVRTESVIANNLQVNYQTLTDQEINNLRGALVQSGDVTAFTFGFSSNRVDNPQDPAKGFFVSPSVEFGSSQFTYQRPRINPDWKSATETPTIPRVLVEPRFQSGGFGKWSLDLRQYRSLDGARKDLNESKRVWASRILIGFATGNLPFSEQYFMGGPDNLRGYVDDRFWGNRQLLISNELRVPFGKDNPLGGVLFLDYGDAWGAAAVNRDDVPGFSQHTRFQPSTGYGVGLRINIGGIGRIRLDYGFDRSGRGRSHFSIGQTF